MKTTRSAARGRLFKLQHVFHFSVRSVVRLTSAYLSCDVQTTCPRRLHPHATPRSMRQLSMWLRLRILTTSLPLFVMAAFDCSGSIRWANLSIQNL